jgi:hypothetical protein
MKREFWQSSACCPHRSQTIWRWSGEKYELAMLFRDLSTLRTEVAVFESLDQLRWRGPTPAFAQIGPRLDAAVVQTGNRKIERKK